MNWEDEKLYLTVIASHVRAVWKAARSLREAEAKMLTKEAHEFATEVVIQGGIISRFFKGTPPTKGRQGVDLPRIVPSRRSYLTDTLQIRDSVFLKSQELRNFVEHIDEYLDIFLNRQKSGPRIFSDLSFGSALCVTRENGAPVDPTDFEFRRYDPATKTYYCLDRQYDLKRLLGDCNRLANSIKERYAAHGDDSPFLTIFDRTETSHVTPAGLIFQSLEFNIRNRAENLFHAVPKEEGLISELIDFIPQIEKICGVPGDEGVHLAAQVLGELAEFCQKISKHALIARSLREGVSVAISRLWEWKYRVAPINTADWT